MSSSTSTSVKNRDRILEAIDQLRRRKARPDVQRICNYLFRRFSVNSIEARNDLDWCVANNYVLKVEYKGNISYRNAAKKFAQMRQRGGGDNKQQLNKQQPQQQTTQQPPQQPPQDKNNAGDVASTKAANRQFGELLTNAFGELIVDEPDYLETGIPGDEIIENILTKDSVRYTRKYVGLLIDKEVARGGLIKMENGNYHMGPVRNDDEDLAKREREKKDTWRGGGGVATEVGAAAAVVVGGRSTTTTATSSTVTTGEGSNGNRNNNEESSSSSYFDRIKAKKKTTFDKKTHNNKQEMFENVDSSTNSADERKNDSNSLRTGGRRKRAKKVFDPSDTHIPKKRGRPLGSLNKSTIEKHLAKMNEEIRPDSRTSNSSSRDHGGVCSVCRLQNKRGPNERMVSCRECSNKAHLSCLNTDDNMMLKMYPDNTWQCPHCKTCVICYETSNSGNLVVCSVCADAYHASCHQPRLSDKIRSGQKWKCTNCQMPHELKVNEIHSNIGKHFGQKSSLNSSENNDFTMSYSGGSSRSNSSPPSPTPPHLSPQMIDSRGGNDSPDDEEQSDAQSKDSDYEEDIDPSIPDATHWSVEEVYQYFVQYFPDEARIFKDHEIDGRSLLLLKRMDVLTNLNLKLGPALKIYKHVVKLQVRRDDPKLYWL